MDDSTTTSEPVLRGLLIDGQTRCVHYHGPTDVIAIAFRCCGVFYPCFRCHRIDTDHPIERWPVAERDCAAVLCGVCRTRWPISTYVLSSSCPHCRSAFNPRCALHHDLYFEPETAAGAS